jgi:predicted AAA+ superfamily ATPase
MIPPDYHGRIVIDLIQRVPELLNEVHDLIASKNHVFILAGSSARKLRKKGVNLLAGRALTYYMHPVTAIEQESELDVAKSLLLFRPGNL